MIDPKKQKQIERAQALQDLLLEDFERMLKDKTMSPTDRATLVKLLSANGWSIDPAMLPKGIADKLTQRVDPTQFDEDDADVPRVN